MKTKKIKVKNNNPRASKVKVARRKRVLSPEEQAEKRLFEALEEKGML